MLKSDTEDRVATEACRLMGVGAEVGEFCQLWALVSIRIVAAGGWRVSPSPLPKVDEGLSPCLRKPCREVGNKLVVVLRCHHFPLPFPIIRGGRMGQLSSRHA